MLVRIDKDGTQCVLSNISYVYVQGRLYNTLHVESQLEDREQAAVCDRLAEAFPLLLQRV